MKTNTKSFTRTGLAALVGTAVIAGAIERPKGEQTTEEAPKDIPAEPQGGVLRADQRPAEEKNDIIEKVAFLGVGGDEAGAALMHQLELENGLVLTQIAPDSPAALAGLAEHDVVVSIDDNPLSDQDSLRQALQDYKPGDEVELQLVRRGEKIDQKVVLGEKQAIPHALIPEPARNLNDLLNKQLGQQLGGIENDQLRKQLLEQVERAFGPDGPGGVMELKLDLDGKDFFQGGNRKNGFKGFGTMRLQDNEGSIEMKKSDGQQELTIRDKEGNLLFNGPYDTEIDKEAVPEEYRDRVERLLGNGGGFRLKFGGDLRQRGGDQDDE